VAGRVAGSGKTRHLSSGEIADRPTVFYEP